MFLGIKRFDAGACSDRRNDMTSFENWGERELAIRIDHTLIRLDAAKEDFVKLCVESARYGFCMVAVNSAVVRLCRKPV